MLKRTAFFLVLVFLACRCYGEEETSPETGLKELAGKIEVIEKKVDKVAEESAEGHKELEEIKKEVKQLREVNEKLTLFLRNLEIYVKGASSLRPEESQWESITRGMESGDVSKILAQPEEITILRRGGEVWYYYGLGSITFNERGFVTERKNFKDYPPKK
jgi:hypothetical protein